MQTFNKQERLCRRKVIKQLFSEGKSFLLYPFRIVWIASPKEDSLAKILISVPKRNFKKAVTRNLLKRRIREAYRKNKTVFYQNISNNEQTIAFTLYYVAKDVLEYSEIESKIILTLQRLSKSINEENN